jgi:hypothetical protein
MRGVTAVAVLAVAAVVPNAGAPALAGHGIRGASATAQALPSRAGARPVQLTLTLRQELQCGRLRSRSVLVVFPRAFPLPQRIAVGALSVGGRAPASVSVSQSKDAVEIVLAPRQGPICDVIAPGSVDVVFQKAAHLANPAHPGRYAISVTAGREQAVASLRIH